MARRGKRRLADLNRKMFKSVDAFPAAGNELIDFHFKNEFDGYLAGLQETWGRKLFVSARDGGEIAAALRRLVLIADLVVFTADKYAVQPGTSLFPIQDSVASEVLGLALGMDPTGRHYIPNAAEAALMVNSLVSRAADSGKPETVFGIEWNGQGSNWGRSFFNRTSQEFVNDRGEPCHIAVGLTHIWHMMEDGLLEEARDLLTAGRAAFAPFIRTSPGSTGTDESLLKAGLFDAGVMVQHSEIHSEGTVHPLSEIEIPYLEAVPLPLLAKIVEDEGESLRAFRTHLTRALEDIKESVDPTDVRREIKKLKRDLLEDELDRVRQICERVSRMNALTRIGAYVAAGALTIAGVMGLSPPAIVCGAGGVATATVAELYKNYEEMRNLRRSPMYFVWRLGCAER